MAALQLMFKLNAKTFQVQVQFSLENVTIHDAILRKLEAAMQFPREKVLMEAHMMTVLTYMVYQEIIRYGTFIHFYSGQFSQEVIREKRRMVR